MRPRCSTFGRDSVNAIQVSPENIKLQNIYHNSRLQVATKQSVPIFHYNTFFNFPSKTANIKHQKIITPHVNKRYLCSKSTDDTTFLNSGEEDEKQLEHQKLLEMLGEKVLTQNEYKDLISKKYSTTKETLTPLGEILKSEIEMNGPLPVKTYMSELLLNQKYGYYTTKQVFGKSGDFVTAPEISPIFGEMLGIWVCQIQELLNLESIRIVEYGPGKGTLASDLVRSVSKILKPNDIKLNYHLIEASPKLIKTQSKTLQCSTDPSLPENKNKGIAGQNGATFYWNESLSDIQGNDPVIIIAQEYFDALPVNIFEFTENGWCEVTVETDNDPTSEYHFKFVLSKSKTLNSIALNKIISLTGVKLPPKVGTKVEISYNMITQLEEICTQLAKRKGVSLMIDYGNNYSNGVTLRGIKNHKFVSVLSQPGSADVTVDVNFALIRNFVQSCSQKEKLMIHGPVYQEELLKELGIHSRALSVVDNIEDEKSLKEFSDAYIRLTSPTEMGAIYKAIAISDLSLPHCPGFSAP